QALLAMIHPEHARESSFRRGNRSYLAAQHAGHQLFYDINPGFFRPAVDAILPSSAGGLWPMGRGQAERERDHVMVLQDISDWLVRGNKGLIIALALLVLVVNRILKRR